MIRPVRRGADRPRRGPVGGRPAHLLYSMGNENMWVQHYPIPGMTEAVWSVFDSGGTLLGEIAAPLGFEPHHIGDDFLLGTWRDELDVEYVQLYVLHKEMGAGG